MVQSTTRPIDCSEKDTYAVNTSLFLAGSLEGVASLAQELKALGFRPNVVTFSRATKIESNATDGVESADPGHCLAQMIPGKPRCLDLL